MNILNRQVSAVVVQEKLSALESNFKSYSHKLWGKSVKDYATSSLQNIPYSTVDVETSDEIASEVKNVLDDSDITIIIFSDTPLLTYKTILKGMETLISNNLSALKLIRGFIFKTDYLKRINDFSNIQTYNYDEQNFISASSYKQLAVISEILRKRILDYHMAGGVYIMDLNTTYIDSDVVIGSGTTIYPNNHLQGSSVIMSDVTLKPNNVIKNSKLCSGAMVFASVIEDSEIGRRTSVGPYAYIRGGASVGDDCRVGDYVEIKKSKIGNGTKMAHLTYVGDATVGKECNLGCGVVFANYDGKNKHNTIVGDRVFIGSNSNLIAPVKIDDGAFIAAATTVTENVPTKKMAIGRCRQQIKDYKSKYLSEE